MVVMTMNMPMAAEYQYAMIRIPGFQAEINAAKF